MTRRRKQTQKRRPYRPSRGRSSHEPIELPPSLAGVRLDRLSLRDAIGICTMLAVFSAALVGGGFIGGGDDLITRWEYATRAETVPGTVTAVVDGRPEVVFTTVDGVEVTTIARGTHTHGGSLRVDVLHLPGEPEEAALPNGLWLPPLLYCGPAVVLAVTLVRVAAGMREGSDLEFLPAAAAALLLLPGLNLLFQGWWRYLEDAPREKPPAPPRLLPEGVILGGWVLSVPVVIAALVVAFVVGIRGEHIEDPVHGTGTVLSTGCGDINTGKSCGDRVVVEYDADGLRYVAVVGDLGRDLNAGARLPLVWDAGDPMKVRSDEEGIDN